MDVAASSIGFISLAFQSFKICVQAFELFTTAQSIGTDGDLLRTGLAFEEYRLMVWAERVGIDSDSPRESLNWFMAKTFLEQLRGYLASADRLRSRYYLDVTEESIQAQEAAMTAEGTAKSGIAKVIARLKPEAYTAAGKIIQDTNSTVKRLRWATRGKDKMTRYLGDIAGLINKLEFLLERAERDYGRGEYDMLVREVVSLTSTSAEAEQIKAFMGGGVLVDGHRSRLATAINAAVNVKQIRLALGADRRDDEVRPVVNLEEGSAAPIHMPTLIKIKKLKPWGDQQLAYRGLEFATYHKSQVLVQWKVAEGVDWERYKRHTKCLAVLLMSLTDPSFRSLPCIGHHALEEKGRHGIVYATPHMNTAWLFKSLRDLIDNSHQLSLRRRIEISLALAETVLQLHTAGWMHKSLRSEHVVFLAPAGSDAAAFLRSEPLVVGYEYARSDTEDSARAYTQLPDTELEADIYRHPQSRGPLRETYQKRFDLYALACVLVELAAWKPLVEVFSAYAAHDLAESIRRAKDTDEVVDIPALADLFAKQTAVEHLEHQAGEIVVEAIRLCHTAEKAREGQEGLLKTQMGLVQKLRLCKV